MILKDFFPPSAEGTSQVTYDDCLSGYDGRPVLSTAAKDATGLNKWVYPVSVNAQTLYKCPSDMVAPGNINYRRRTYAMNLLRHRIDRRY